MKVLSKYASELLKYKHGLGPVIEALEQGMSLPFIRGTWFFVDPYAGSNSNSGLSIDDAVADLQTAYALCTDGVGDGIAVLSGGTTSANTTSYLKQTLTWSKSGVTVIGICAPVSMYQRARVANVEVTTGALTVLAFVQGAEAVKDKITRTTGSFITDGFEAGQYITVNTTGNGADATGLIIETVEALTLTLTTIGTLVTETAGNAGSSTVKSYNPTMLNVTGSNNIFLNIHVGNFSSDAGALGAVKVTGNRNYFGNCNFIGAGHATPAAVAGAYDLEINGGQENTFERCVFGTDSVLRAAANANIRFDSDAWRTRFYGCQIICQSATAGKGGLMSVDATALNGVQVFKECQFINWNDNGIGNSTSMFIGTKPNSGAFLLDGCSLVGWTAWDSVGGNDIVYVVNSDATASGAGGIATNP